MRAAHVTTFDLVNNRLAPNPMEPRAAIGEYVPATTATRSGPPAKIPKWRGWSSPPLSVCPRIKQIAGDRAGCRGALRLEDLHLCGRDGLRLGGQEGRPSVKWTCERSEAFFVRRARARPCHPCRTRA